MTIWTLWTPFFAGLATLIVVVGVGCVAASSDKTIVAITSEAIGRGVMCIAFCLGMYALVPSHKALFLGFGTELPAITHVLFGISDSVVLHPISLFSLFLIASVTDVAFVFLLHRNEDTRSVAKCLSGSITVVSAVGILFCVLAVLMPAIKIHNDLS